MDRRDFLVSHAVLGLACWVEGTLLAQEPSLEDMLKFGLKARRPVEIQFVAAVASLTNSGALPKDYVLAAFDYSRKRRPKLPMPYFDVIIRRKAEELGVDIGVPSTLEN